MMMEYRKKNRIVLIFSVIGIVLFVYLVIYPLIQNIQKNAADLVSEQGRLTKLDLTIQELKNTQAILNREAQNIAGFNDLFADSENPIAFIEFLEQEAERLELTAKISPCVPQKIPGDPWASMDLQLSLVGLPQNFLRFLEKLEAAPYLIEISGLNVRVLRERDIGYGEFKGFSAGDIAFTIFIKVFAK